MKRVARISRLPRFNRVAGSLALAMVMGFICFGAANAAGTPGTSAASGCTIAPRQIPASGGAAPTVIVTTVAPLATPFNPPAGLAVAKSLANDVSATIREAIACANSGDLGRSLALLSDRAFAAYLSGPNGLDRGILQLASGTPAPAPPAEQLTLVSINGIAKRDDGRIGATVVTRNRLATYTDYVILVFEHDHWAIDESVPLSTVPSGTPAATP